MRHFFSAIIIASTYIIFNLFIHCTIALDYLEYPSNGINTTAISEVLNRLINPANYDKRLRPRYGAGPVDVGITIHVSSISAVSEVDMDFTLDFYLRQTWQDPRLAFGNLYTNYQNDKIESLTVGVDYLDKLWKPDTFFPNEKKSFFHTATTHNSFLRIDPNGNILTSQRLTVTATCPMKLQLFPMDSQKCKLEIESYAYTEATINYHWCQLKDLNCKKSVRLEASIRLPNYRITNFCVNRTSATTSSGTYSRLWVKFVFKRQLNVYLLQIFVPAILVVLISWVSFWINQDSAPSRTTIGTLTVLSVTHLLTGTNRRLPPVSYIKAVDIYIGFCYLIVVLALIEYAVVAYTKKKRDDQKKRFRNKGIFELMPLLETPDLLKDARIDVCTCPQDASVLAVVMRPRRLMECCKHSRTDLIARLLFPFSFAVFNVIYWTTMISMSEWFTDDDQMEC